MVACRLGCMTLMLVIVSLLKVSGNIPVRWFLSWVWCLFQLPACRLGCTRRGKSLILERRCRNIRRSFPVHRRISKCLSLKWTRQSRTIWWGMKDDRLEVGVGVGVIVALKVEEADFEETAGQQYELCSQSHCNIYLVLNLSDWFHCDWLNTFGQRP